MRQLIGAPVQLPVGHCLLIKYQRNRPRSALCLLFKYLVNWLVLRKSCVCGVPSYQQLFLLLFRQQRQVSDVLIGITHNGFEQGLPVSCDARKVGLPDRSVRSTSVFRKNPIMPSISLCLRPAVAVPTSISSCSV